MCDCVSSRGGMTRLPSLSSSSCPQWDIESILTLPIRWDEIREETSEEEQEHKSVQDENDDHTIWFWFCVDEEVNPNFDSHNSLTMTSLDNTLRGQDKKVNELTRWDLAKKRGNFPSRLECLKTSVEKEEKREESDSSRYVLSSSDWNERSDCSVLSCYVSSPLPHRLRESTRDMHRRRLLSLPRMKREHTRLRQEENQNFWLFHSHTSSSCSSCFSFLVLLCLSSSPSKSRKDADDFIIRHVSVCMWLTTRQSLVVVSREKGRKKERLIGVVLWTHHDHHHHESLW